MAGVHFVSDDTTKKGNVAMIWVDDLGRFHVWNGHYAGRTRFGVRFENYPYEDTLSASFSPVEDECGHPYGQIRLETPWHGRNNHAWTRAYTIPFQVEPLPWEMPLQPTDHGAVVGFYIETSLFKPPCSNPLCKRSILVAGTMVIALDPRTQELWSRAAKNAKLRWNNGKVRESGEETSDVPNHHEGEVAIACIFSNDGGSFSYAPGALQRFVESEDGDPDNSYFALYFMDPYSNRPLHGKLTRHGIQFRDGQNWQRSTASSWFPQDGACN